MKLNAWHFFGGIAILLWVVMNASQPNFGFATGTGSEVTGFNVGHLILPIIGLSLIFVGSRSKDK